MSSAKPAGGYEGPACPYCQKAVPATQRRPGQIRCQSCLNEFEAVFFEPPREKVEVVELASAGPDGATPCVDHPGNAAVSECSRCGSFICGLCRIDVAEKPYCPRCFDLAKDSEEGTDVVGHFRDYGSMASGAAVVGCLFYVLSFAIGPLAIYYGVMGLRQKKKLNETDGLVGIWVAMVLGVIETAVGLFFVFAVIAGLAG